MGEPARAALEAIIEAGIAARTLPGAVVAYGAGDDGRVAFAGHLDYHQGTPVRSDTIYDIASLTKPVATVACLMRLVTRGELSLDTRVCEVLPAVPPDICFTHLLAHCSGYPAHIEFFKLGLTRDELFERVATTPRAYPPGEKSVYSDLGYLLLGQAVERLTASRLDVATEALITGPLGMQETRYHPVEQPVRELERIAPTEDCPWREELVRGRVHDENAYAAGGVCGHAGLFSTAPDLVRFARAILAAWNGDSGGIFEPTAIERFLTTAPSEGSWRLGWDTPSEGERSHAGELWPRDQSVGHLGFTGSAMWLHRPSRSYAIILSNRVHPTREDGSANRELRRRIMDEVARQLGIARERR